MYFTLTTLTTVGYGDITPVSTFEKFITSFIMLLGVMFYSYTIGMLTSIMTEMDKKNSKLSKRVEILNEIAKEYKLNQAFRWKIIKALKYEENQNKQDRLQLVNSLPQNLKVALAVKMNALLIQNSIFLKQRPGHLIAAISPYLKPYKINKNEYVYREGDPADEMYFIIKGEFVLITKLDETELAYASIIEGQHFGDLEFYYQMNDDESSNEESIEVDLRYIRTDSVKAISQSELLSLPKNDFIQIFNENKEHLQYLWSLSLE